jgi:hypothetical protein
MSRRIDVELTSERADGTWTWRAAGAKQPKGDLDGTLLFAGAKVGDVVRAEADFDIDGITIIAVQPSKEKERAEPERIEVIGTVRNQPGVTSTLVEKGRRRERSGERRDRDGRGPREGEGRGARGNRGERGGQGEQPRERRPRPERPPRPEIEAKPKPKRLRPGRTNRQAVVAALPEEHKPIAEQVLRGGIPAVRQAIDKQNEDNRTAGQPEIHAAPLVAIAEDLLPRLRTAEWQDRAEAALADVDELDLRDLRSVVVAADGAAKDKETRALADQLRTALAQRVEAEHRAWLDEIDALLRDGRVVRALRVSSRPPKAGTPFPAELSARLVELSSAALTSDTSPERFATVIDALAYAPVRQNVKPQGVPEKPGDELRAVVEKLASRIPQIAAEFGIEVAATPPPRAPRSPRGQGGPGGRGGRRDRRSTPTGPRPVPPPPVLPPASPATTAAPTAPADAPTPPTEQPHAPAPPATPQGSEGPAAPEGSAGSEGSTTDAAETAAPVAPPTGVPVTDG